MLIAKVKLLVTDYQKMKLLIIKIYHLFTYFCTLLAQVVELVDTLDSKSSASRRAGSIPALSTKNLNILNAEVFFRLMKIVFYFLYRLLAFHK